MKKLGRRSRRGLFYTKITGLIQGKEVISWVYPGKDSDMNHFMLDGRKYKGTREDADFEEITVLEKIGY